MEKSNYENKKSPSFLVMKSFYDPKAYHLLSKRNLKLTILYLIILSFVINVFTLILPYAPIIIKNHGVKQMLNVAIPNFEYNNGEIAIDTFKCDINEKDNSILLVDTSKDLSEEILKSYSSGVLIGKQKAIQKDNDIISTYVYKNYMPIDSFSKTELLSFKIIALIYIFMFLVVLFANIFLFLLFFVEALILYAILKIINHFTFKIKFKHKFRTLFNVATYSLGLPTILKAFLQSFDIAPLPFVMNHWFTLVQVVISLTIAIFGLRDIKKHKLANMKLKTELDSGLSESERLDLELGFDTYELEIKKQIKEQALKLNNELKEKKDNKK